MFLTLFWHRFFTHFGSKIPSKMHPQAYLKSIKFCICFLNDFGWIWASILAPIFTKIGEKGRNKLGTTPIFFNFAFCCLLEASLVPIFLDLLIPGHWFSWFVPSFLGPSCCIFHRFASLAFLFFCYSFVRVFFHPSFLFFRFSCLLLLYSCLPFFLCSFLPICLSSLWLSSSLPFFLSSFFSSLPLLPLFLYSFLPCFLCFFLSYLFPLFLSDLSFLFFSLSFLSFFLSFFCSSPGWLKL